MYILHLLFHLGVCMQTFLPFTDYQSCAHVLDNIRLNKQIVEAYQIYTGRVPQKNHPACLMWKGHEKHLLIYITAMLEEYENRFHKTHAVRDNIFGDNVLFYDMCKMAMDLPALYVIDHDLVQISHMVNLIRKDGIYYGKTLRSHLYTNSRMVYGRYVALDEFPEGYYWPVEPVGKKAMQDRENWLNFK